MDWYSGSLLPPDVDELADTNPPKCCLLGRKPFLGNRTNATTASCNIEDDLDDDIAIQVSFFAARPPRVSYILAWSFGTYFTEEPRVVSTDGGLVLLSFAVHSERSPFSEYYIYQPGAQSLDLIPQHRGGRFVDPFCSAGLLSHGGGSSGYHVVTLTRESNGEFELSVFSSGTQTWTLKKPVLLLEDGAANLANYVTFKAIALGGGYMAFVDLWNGILICDVLDADERPELHYLPLPSTTLGKLPSSCYPLQPRDINISVSSDTICIKLAEVVYPPTSEAWCTDIWIATFMASSPWRQIKGWLKESTDGSELVVAEGLSLDGLLDWRYRNTEPTLGRLFVDNPMFSLDQDNVVCFLAKKHASQSQAWVIAVDIAKKKLQGVNCLQVGRSSALFYSTISGHLNMTAAASGARGDLKRHAAQLESYPHKKQQHLHVLSSSFGEHGQGFMEAHDGDAMDSEHGDRV